MKSQAGLIIHAKMAKITARVIVTIGKIRLKRSLFAELSTGLGTVPNPLAVGIDAFSNKNDKKDTNLRMNSTLEDMIKGKYNLIKTDSDYKNSADIRDTVELINLLNRRTGKLTPEYIQMKEDLEKISSEK